MPEPETSLEKERIRFIKKVYRSRRFEGSRQSDGFPWDDVVIGVLGGGASLLVTPESDPWTKFLVGAVSGLVAVFAWHTLIRPAIRYIWTVPLQMHVEQAERIRRLEETNGSLENQLAIRKKSRAIHKLMLRERSDAIALLNRRVNGPGEYAAWKGDWVSWESHLVGKMHSLECSPSEIHGVQRTNIGAVGKLHVGKDSEHPESSKAVLLIQIQQIEKVAAAHDTAKPTAI